MKHFADDMSHFTRDKDKNESTNIINNKLLQISKWVYNWKMLFNPDPNKPAQEKTKYKFIQPYMSTIYKLKEHPIKNT